MGTLRSFCSSASVKLQKWLDRTVQAAGPSYIILAFLLMSGVIYLFFTTILPALHDIYTLRGALHVVVALWLVLNVFFNYLHCISTDPGSPHAADQALSYTPTRWCKHCGTHKPPFTHHCHICKRCILRMDHHCPWMHNCVGFNNYRFFIVFLFYLWIGCGYSMYMSSQLLFDDNYNENELQLLLSFVLSFAIGGAVSSLLGWHVFLVLTAQTTIDFYANKQQKKEARMKGEVWVNKYDVGKVQNVKNLFYCGGREFWWLVLLLPTTSKPIGDGISFPCRYQSPV